MSDIIANEIKYEILQSALVLLLGEEMATKNPFLISAVNKGEFTISVQAIGGLMALSTSPMTHAHREYGGVFDVLFDQESEHVEYSYFADDNDTAISMYRQFTYGDRQVFMTHPDHPDVLVHHHVNFKAFADFMDDDDAINMPEDTFSFVFYDLSKDRDVANEKITQAAVTMIVDSFHDLHLVGRLIRDIRAEVPQLYNSIMRQAMEEISATYAPVYGGRHHVHALQEFELAARQLPSTLPDAIVQYVSSIEYTLDMNDFTRSEMVITDTDGQSFHVNYLDTSFNGFAEGKTGISPSQLFTHFIREAVATGQSAGHYHASEHLTKKQRLDM